MSTFRYKLHEVRVCCQIHAMHDILDASLHIPEQIGRITLGSDRRKVNTQQELFISHFSHER